MLALKLAYRNLVAAGLRTWLNVGVLSFTYVLIIWHQGLFTGMLRHASRHMIADEIAGGQYWHANYDPYDPLSLDQSAGPLPQPLAALVQSAKATSILIRPATIYPEGRMQTILLKGIDPAQKILNMPTSRLDRPGPALPVMIGGMTAKKKNLGLGDFITIRWRDAKGTFDAVDGQIVEIMHTSVPGIDLGQIWVSLERLQTMSGLAGQATMVVVDQAVPEISGLSQWRFKTPAVLIEDITRVVKSKRIGGAVFYVILLFLSMLAIFDTQVLSIFRRRKEIGTLMAFGMVRSSVIALFTLEGAMHGILGMAVATVYGLPLLIWSAVKGIPMPGVQEYGLALPTRLFPIYTAFLVGLTVLIILLTVTIVSYLPSRKISGWTPTDALKGKYA